MRNWRPDGVTLHGVRRLRKRVGIPARGVVRHLATVRAEGLSPAQLHRDELSLMRAARLERNGEDPTEYLIYQGFVYVFSETTKALVTVYALGEEHN